MGEISDAQSRAREFRERQDTECYSAIQSLYRISYGKNDGAFQATQDLLIDSGPLARLNASEPIKEIISYLESDMSGKDTRQNMFRELRASLPRTDPVQAMKLAATKYDGIHPDPEMDHLGSILRHLQSMGNDREFFESTEPHHADGAISPEQLAQEPEVQKKIERELERRSEIAEHQLIALTGFKNSILDGIFSDQQRQWPQRMINSVYWLETNIEGAENLGRRMLDASNELNKIGVLISYGHSPEDAVDALLRGREAHTERNREKELGHEA